MALAMARNWVRRNSEYDPPTSAGSENLMSSPGSRICRVPGSRPAVVEHEEWGERARNAALAVGVLELLGLVFALRRSPKSHPRRPRR